tara:strand:- start:79 stop:549 length:471 start_codon:yes stop_codon:yes gene_type:complete
MANTTMVGSATVYGVDGTVAYGTVIIGENYMQSCNVTDDVDTAEARDEKGNVFGYNLYNFRRTANFEIIFYGGTEVLAAAAVELPVPGAIITIAQNDDGTPDYDTLPPILVGGWNYIGGGGISMSNTDLLRMTLPCSQYNGDDDGGGVTTMQTFTH